MMLLFKVTLIIILLSDLLGVKSTSNPVITTGVVEVNVCIAGPAVALAIWITVPAGASVHDPLKSIFPPVEVKFVDVKFVEFKLVEFKFATLRVPIVIV